jgi:hypothetical protein
LRFRVGASARLGQPKGWTLNFLPHATDRLPRNHVAGKESMNAFTSGCYIFLLTPELPGKVCPGNSATNLQFYLNIPKPFGKKMTVLDAFYYVCFK